MYILELLKTILLGVVEGITEWLPISSTGHMILLDEFIKLNVSDADVYKRQDKYTVTYTDGVDGEEIFPDQVYTDLLFGDAIPEFVGIPTREGYVFAGW